MIILSVDSTAKAAAAAVCDDEKPLSHVFLNTALTHSQTLLTLVDQALKNANLTIDDVGLFAVSNGPGSFTGVRIGVSLVKGLAFGRDVMCAGVSTLEALARNAEGFGGVCCAVMDARNNQVYNALFEINPCGFCRLTPDRAISTADLREELLKFDCSVILTGDGAELSYEALRDIKNVSMANETARLQNAVSVARAAFYMYKEGKCVPASQLDVNYLRLSQAEREYEKKHKGDNTGK
ncbi:MAG: tRNA (adenosine(37)-N6)-threonylcarbamoyltransferase complex dimerization subunit type 1 TsaB [Clostridia bacterium]|nr:tRNA (adenosine(37)-N6)-threonylcarbamoyltransferase complex dimerization subunit type 1 TsaB [Clostridia bacterium]